MRMNHSTSSRPTMPKLPNASSWSCLFTLLIANAVALCVFSKGFFPLNSVIQGYADLSDLPPLPRIFTGTTESSDEQQPPTPPEPLRPQFGRLVFLLIDALRNDFVFGRGSGFDFTRSLLAERKAHAFTAIATAPTVTLPRLKALTTGSIPNFLDAILNIAESDTSSSLKGQDSWVAQLKLTGKKKIAFYGDDTWIKLFPDMFERSEGTTSFFVSDTVEVDRNVTRHVQPELERDDWDALILHYLGLDHIGHLAGPQSPLMLPKQQEMDSIVALIYKEINKQDTRRQEADPDAAPTLFVLCGDHGMNEVGNHGGSSTGEASTLFIFMSGLFEKGTKPNLDTSTTELQEQSFSFPTRLQVDLVPTISLLFGVAIPKNNLGKVIMDLFASRSDSDRLRALQLNSHQLTSVLYTAWPKLASDPTGLEFTTSTLRDVLAKDCASVTSDSADMFECWLARAAASHAQFLAGNVTAGKEAVHAYEKFLDAASAMISLSFSEYDVNLLVNGFLMSLACSAALCYVQYRSRARSSGLSEVLWWLMTILYSVTLFASSYIEEEHLFWYHISTTTWSLLLLSCLRSDFSPSGVNRRMSAWISLTQLFLLRLMRSWNQTGVKHADAIDLRYYLTTTYNSVSWLSFDWTIGALSALTLYLLYRSHRPHWQNLYAKGSFALLVATVCMAAASVRNYKLRSTSSTGSLASHPGDESESIIDAARRTYVKIAALLLAGALLPIFRKLRSTKGKKGSALPISDGLRITGCFCLTLLLVLLSRPHNVVLYFFSALQAILHHRFFASFANGRNGAMTTTAKHATLVLATQTSFFLFGGSNSLATVDIGNSYVGVSGYSPSVVGALTFLANWAGPIWWSAISGLLISTDRKRGKSLAELGNEDESGEGALKRSEGDDGISATSSSIRTPPHPSTTANRISRSRNSREYRNPATSVDAIDAFDPPRSENENENPILRFLFLQLTFRSIAVTFLSLSVTLLRSHLFIWTVFSPRWLYEVVWTLLFSTSQILLVYLMGGRW